MNDHVVQFYEDEVFLVKGLADYIGAALDAGHKGIAIATGAHLRSLEASLTARGLLDATGQASRGNYIPLQAEQLLHLFMEDGLPNEAAFRVVMGGLVNDSKSPRQPIYVFGEMVAILCAPSHGSLYATGRHEAAIRVERFFNKLQHHFQFSLLCAYPLSAFPNSHDALVFEQVCALHTEVRPAESYDPHASRHNLQRTIASLQQQAYSLAAEVHDRRQVEQALRDVNIDRLTGLPNRNVFHDRLEMDIKKAHRSGLPLALLFIDLDHFKEINDTLGHQIGDLLLKQVGQRLQTYVRETDTVARLGGDEFTITLAELHDTGKVTDVAQNIRNDLARPFRLEGELAYISASIGITLYPRDGNKAGDLLRNADQAMYQSKDHGRNRFTYFTASMQEAAQARMVMSNELRRALEEEQLAVFYQPIVDMRDDRIRKAEALLRWDHPQLGRVSPVDFIPIAEHTGLIVEMGNWVFRHALQQARRWRALEQALTVNVNVSPAQFYHANGENCRNWVKDNSLALTQDQPNAEVGLEITEGLLLASNSLVTKQLLAFHQAGISISLDDFGTGYSSLSYLRKFNLDYLKIDKSFVYNLEYDAANVALCEAIIVMAHKLGLKVVAEGVETREQDHILRRAGCDYGQGFLFGAPVPAAQFEVLLQDGKLVHH
ncbi:MAG: putative bifunctional diguanylate cyclase/phosphodiesterase [Massilia sp.]